MSNQMRYLAAAAILAAGGICAAGVYSRPVEAGGPDPEQILSIAERVSAAEPAHPPALSVPPPRRSIKRQSTSRATSPRAANPPVSLRPSAVQSPEAASGVKPAAESPVQQIALLGVTQQGDELTAWLVDLETQARAEAEVGESAFGFDVKEVGADSVVLALGDAEYTVRLGEKEIPVVEVSQPVSAPRPAPNAANTNRGRIRSRDRGTRTVSNRGGSSRYGSRRRSSDRGRRSSSSARSSSGYFGGFPRTFSSRTRGQGTPSFLGPTSNPQEARRLGVSLIGGGTPIPVPRPPQNPQTQRRRGIAGGPAFGETSSRTQTQPRR